MSYLFNKLSRFEKIYGLVLCLFITGFISFVSRDNAIETSNQFVYKQPLLMDYAEQGNLSKVQELLAIGKSVDSLDHCKWSPLMKAAQYGHLDVVNILLLQGADVEQADKGKYTALLLAASQNNAEIIEVLLNYGANINHQEESMGWTALIWAAKLNHLETVKVLLKHQANRKIIDQKGYTALAWAKSNAFQEMVDLLSK